jgi:protease-4
VQYPPGMMPPMMNPMMPPMMMAPPRRSGWRTLFRVLGVMALVCSIFFNFILMGSSVLGGKSTLRTAIVDGDLRETIAVIPVKGMILQNTADRFDRFMSQAERDPNVKAIVIDVETPGGAVTASDQIYHRIDSFKKAHSGVPVVVSMGNMATSGGYYVSAGADYIFAQPTTMTGNIGVIMPRYNVSELAAKWGIHETTVTAPKVGFKNAGSMFSAENEQDKQYLQELIDGAYKRFTKVVKDGRGSKLTKPIDQIADGKVYLADRALAEGLVDAIGFPEDAYNHAAKLASLSRPNVVRYQDPPTLLDLFTAESKANVAPAGLGSVGTGAGGVTINGINLNVDANLLEALKTPRILYMWQGQ